MILILTYQHFSSLMEMKVVLGGRPEAQTPGS